MTTRTRTETAARDSARSYPANINVRLTLLQLEQLQAVADEHGVKLAVVVREALRHGLAAADAAIGAAIEEHQRGQAIAG